MDQKTIGVTEVREAILALGQPTFEVDDVAYELLGDTFDELDKDGERAVLKAIWKALGYMTNLSELRKQETRKGFPSRWKVVRLNVDGSQPKYDATRLVGALTAWKP